MKWFTVLPNCSGMIAGRSVVLYLIDMQPVSEFSQEAQISLPVYCGTVSATSEECVLEPEVDIVRGLSPAGDERSDRASLAEYVLVHDENGSSL
jgi:hypothetical protein